MKSADRMIKRTQPDSKSLPQRLCSKSGALSEIGELSSNPEVFDDSDFYQLLLKEFLEASNATAGMLPLPDRRKKAKAARDRKGSKGRRLRYDVQVGLTS